MKFGSLFSGIEAASVAWKPLGWQCQWVAEIEKFPSAVLAHHYPDTPNLGDVTKVDWESIHATRPVDAIVFGSPCQSFSVAGKRLGLDDPRGNLALYALGVVNRLRPRWFIFENVPGLLSSDEGRDFAAFLRLVGECGYQCAWRVLDAQFFGLAQRRARVFVVGHLGDWRRAAAVLFERESLQGHPPPRREAGQRIADSLTVGTNQCSGPVHAFDARQSDVIQYGDKTGPLDTDGHTMAIAFTAKDHGADAGDIAPTLRAGGHAPDGLRYTGSQVRRLTPEECEKLQGFEPGYTLVPWRKGMAPDGLRYKALGNSFAVPVVRWIGERIAMVERLAPP
jgi:DNA (cytosine-5)-methyltransferase 1